MRAWVDRRAFWIRDVSRHPDFYRGPADEVGEADLNRPETLEAAFAAAYGVFAVSNFWELGSNEIAQGRNATDAAKKVGVSHFVWSTSPDVETISGGEFGVAHFTSKAKVDAFVRDAGLASSIVVEAPFCFENLTTNTPASPLPDGSLG